MSVLVSTNTKINLGNKFGIQPKITFFKTWFAEASNLRISGYKMFCW